MRIFTSASHNNAHNICTFGLQMSCKSLQYNAPGETRTPNLLIRSQPVPPTGPASTAGIGTETATQIPKADKTSRNNSHNTELLS